MNRGNLDIARRADFRPAYEHFAGRVRASDIVRHGSYAAARKALDEMNAPASPPAQQPAGENRAPLDPVNPRQAQRIATEQAA